jgi:hypothetical protein
MRSFVWDSARMLPNRFTKRQSGDVAAPPAWPRRRRRAVVCHRYAVHDSASDEELIKSFFDEALRLLDTPADELATTMLIIPRYTGSIDEYYEMYEWLTDLLEDPEEEVLNNQVRVPLERSEGLPARGFWNLIVLSAFCAHCAGPAAQHHRALSCRRAR